MAAAGKSESGAPPPAELTAPASTPLSEAIVKIEAAEFARLETEELAKRRSERDEQAQREVVDRAWREQQEYARAVA